MDTHGNTLSPEDQDLLDRAAAAEEYGDLTFKRPAQPGEKAILIGSFRRVGRGLSVYSTAPDGRSDFLVLQQDDGDLVNVYLSESEFARLAELAPQRNERIALVFERIVKRDGGPFNKLTFSKASSSVEIDWTAITAKRGLSEPVQEATDAAPANGEQNVDDGIPF